MKRSWSHKILLIALLMGTSMAFDVQGQFVNFSYRGPRGITYTWVGGTSTASTGVYGTKGTPSTSNLPAARGNACVAVDANDNVWMFGGDNFASKNNLFNDFWRYNPATGEWTWLSGSSSTMGAATYGTKGTPSTSNTPGYRKDSACWIDDSGNYWLFGGIVTNTTNANDLWRYNPSTSEWTWISGSNTTNAAAVYGTKGVADVNNVPSGRERIASWKGPNNTLWFFGGYDNVAGGRMNDLWKYDIATNMWTWMSGSSSINQPGSYGVRGVASSTNVPGGRRNASSPSSVDSAGNFWLFGGDEYISGAVNDNDLWKYNPYTNQWTWVSGSSSPSSAGSYGSLLVPSPNNAPASRKLQSLIVGRGDEIFVFMGYNGAELVDFWSYSQVTDQWTLLSGSNATNVVANYGTINVTAPTNTPGGRDSLNSWRDSKGVLWIFGGLNATKPNSDLWRINRY